MAGKDNIADQLKAKFRDANVFNRHKALGLKNNDQAKTYYVTNLTAKSLSAIGSLNDLMNRWWVAYIRPGSPAGAQSQGVGDGNADNTIGVPGAGIPPLVSIASAIGANKSVVVNYNYNDIGYDINEMEYSLDGALSWYLVPTLPVELPAIGLTATSGTVTIPGLTNNVLYSLTLRVVDTSDTAIVPAAIPVPVRPNVSSAPDAPTSLVATPSSTSVSIAFTAGAVGTSAITGYEYTTDDGTTWVSAGSSTVSPVTVTGLTVSTSYTIKIRAVNAVGAGAASEAVTFTTTATGALFTGGDSSFVSNGYKYHLFTTNGTLTMVNPGNVELLVVGGGGGGGAGSTANAGGGGGGGQYVYNPSFSVTSNVSVTIGAGGAGGSAGQGANGGTTTFDSITAIGGGGGGFTGALPGLSGASGGGGSGSSGASSGGTGTAGYNGGAGFPNATNTLRASGGGGGAGGVGSAATSATAGSGGAGIASTIADGATSIVYCKGGDGSYDQPAAAVPYANVGQGGNGAGRGAVRVGGTGSNGLVVVRYPI